MRRGIPVIVAIALSCSGSASAQMTEHGYVQANGIGTIDNPAMDAEAGVRVTRGLALFVSAGQVDEFHAPRLLRANPFVTGVMQSLAPYVTMSVRASGVYAGGGARYEAGAGRWRIQPYILASIGMARMQQDASFRLSGGGHDVTGPVVRFDLLGRDPSGQVSVPIGTMGAGVSLPMKRLRVDIGYRLSQFVTDGPPVRSGGPTLGLGLRF